MTVQPGVHVFAVPPSTPLSQPVAAGVHIAAFACTSVDSMVRIGSRSGKNAMFRSRGSKATDARFLKEIHLAIPAGPYPCIAHVRQQEMHVFETRYPATPLAKETVGQGFQLQHRACYVVAAISVYPQLTALRVAMKPLRAPTVSYVSHQPCPVEQVRTHKSGTSRSFAGTR